MNHITKLVLELRSKLEIKLHPDSEVLWNELHIPQYHHDEIRGNCDACGHDPLDDRYHLYVFVEARARKYDQAATVLSKLLHKKRAQIIKLASVEEIDTEITKILLG